MIFNYIFNFMIQTLNLLHEIAHLSLTTQVDNKWYGDFNPNVPGLKAHALKRICLK